MTARFLFFQALAILAAGAVGIVASGCVQARERAWYQPSALTVGITAPGLISTPPISAGGGRGIRHNGSLSTVGGIVSLTFPLFPTPTQPQRPVAPPKQSPRPDGQP